MEGEEPVAAATSQKSELSLCSCCGEVAALLAPTHTPNLTDLCTLLRKKKVTRVSRIYKPGDMSMSKATGFLDDFM